MTEQQIIECIRNFHFEHIRDRPGVTLTRFSEDDDIIEQYELGQTRFGELYEQIHGQEREFSNAEEGAIRHLSNVLVIPRSEVYEFINYYRENREASTITWGTPPESISTPESRGWIADGEPVPDPYQIDNRILE